MNLPKKTPLWPEDYKVGPYFCEEVIEGIYEVPYSPEKPIRVIDLGACVGAFSIWASKRWPGCAIEAYEPSQHLFACLERTIRDRNLPVTVHNTAVSNFTGVAKLYEGVANKGENSIVANHGQGYETVHVIKADDLPEAEVLKIDTEGCEMPILITLEQAGRLEKFEVIMLEAHSASDMKRIDALMEKHGFEQMRRNITSVHRAEKCFIRKDVPKDPTRTGLFTEDRRPVVWISTPMKTLTTNGVLTHEIFKELSKNYSDPISEICNAKKLPWRFTLMMAGGDGVARCRNRITAQAKKAGADYVFFVDYDLMPKAKDYIDVLSYMDLYDLDVCGGLYTTRGDYGHWVMNFPDSRGVQPDGGLQVGELGTGFKCYRMRGLDKILEKNPWLECQDEANKQTVWGFFSMGPVKDKLWPGVGRWLSEDYWLDWLTRDANIPIVVNTNVKVRHFDENSGNVYPREFPPLPLPAEEQVAFATECAVSDVAVP